MGANITRRLLGLGLVAGAGACASAPQAQPATPPALDQRLTPLARFVGSWRGTISGEPGT
ncbi:MAG: hypothetical protein AB7G40_17250 [Hyphomonadaceae bacterium]